MNLDRSFGGSRLLRRGLSGEGIEAFHGIGPAALKIIEQEMAVVKVRFKGEGKSSQAPGMPADAIDRYILFSEGYSEGVSRLREIIRSAAPEATERISCRMPTCYLRCNLVYFAASKRHVGLYPPPHARASFETELKNSTSGKGSIRFQPRRTRPRGQLRTPQGTFYIADSDSLRVREVDRPRIAATVRKGRSGRGS